MRTDSLVAVDVHVHIEADGHGCFSLDDELMAASAKYFRADHDRTPTLETIADMYRSLSMAAVVFTVDAGTFTGHQALSSEEIADQAAAHADVLIPFGSVDPLRGASAVGQARVLVEEHGVRGFKFHPSLQGFAPNDAAYYPLWSQIESLGRAGAVPHRPDRHRRRTARRAGHQAAAVGPDAARRRGGGLPMRSPSSWRTLSVPWADSAISMATHKSNVYIDLSGWSPKYFPPALVRAANSYLQDKVLFGTDFPLLTPERWLRDFETLDLKPDVRAKILKHNAIALLNLDRD